MKKIFILVILFFATFKCFSQNLVENWSFEDTVDCPSGLTDITASAGWKIYGNTPDFFHTCNPNEVGVPYNDLGYQLAHTGESYTGILVYNINFTNLREILGRPLTNTLQIGTKYYASFHLVRAVSENAGWKVNIASNNIGVNFSTVEHIFPNGNWPINLNSQVYSSGIITDTITWTKISGSFVADSAYSYIGISNFFPDSITNTISFGNNFQSYYFIDDVCVSPDSNFCDQLQSMKNIERDAFQIFPNPARDWIDVRCENIQSLRFYEVSGRLVKSFLVPIHTTIDISQFSATTYLVAIETKNRIYYTKLFVTN